MEYNIVINIVLLHVQIYRLTRQACPILSTKVIKGDIFSDGVDYKVISADPFDRFVQQYGNHVCRIHRSHVQLKLSGVHQNVSSQQCLVAC